MFYVFVYLNFPTNSILVNKLLRRASGNINISAVLTY